MFFVNGQQCFFNVHVRVFFLLTPREVSYKSFIPLTRTYGIKCIVPLSDKVFIG